MDFPTLCPECAQENRVEFADSSVHDVTCKRCGARYCVLVRKQKFEVLFDLGTRALMDGYVREAVASFSASLERFMEFYVRSFALERAAGTETDFAVAAGALDGTWRHVTSQSERQLGMFALAYATGFGVTLGFVDGLLSRPDEDVWRAWPGSARRRSAIRHTGPGVTRSRIQDGGVWQMAYWRPAGNAATGAWL